MLDLGLVDDSLYAVPFTINVKSLVWYPTQAFESAGYEAPETWDELTALTQQIPTMARRPGASERDGLPRACGPGGRRRRSDGATASRGGRDSPVCG